MPAASVLATVRCGRNGRGSASHPRAANGPVKASPSAESSSAPRSMPSHSARILRDEGGNEPAPESTTSKAARPRSAASTACVTSGTTASGVSPRNRSVTCRESRCTQRAARPKRVVRTGSMSSRQAAFVSGGTGIATNSRWVAPPSATVLDRVPVAVGRQDLEGALPVPPPHDVDLLLLQQLVRVEEVLDLDEAVGAHLLQPVDVLLVRVADRHAQRLEVEPLLVPHLQAADRARPDMTAGERRLVDDQERVRVVAVVGTGPLDEPVVEVVEDRRGEDPVEPVDVRLLVVLVLVPAAPGDLDDDLDDLGEAREVGAAHRPNSTVRRAGASRGPARVPRT